MRVVIAPDSFKSSISARDAAAAIGAGWASVRPDDEIVTVPQADGGERTLDAIEAATPDAVRRSAGLVTGPDGRPVPGEWLELPDGTAVVELAQSSGIALRERPDPLGATTLATWNAVIQPGAPKIATLTGLHRRLGRHDAFITGEGRFDATSLGGKVVGYGLELARECAILDHTTVIAGSFAEPARWLTAAGARAAARHHA